MCGRLMWGPVFGDGGDGVVLPFFVMLSSDIVYRCSGPGIVVSSVEELTLLVLRRMRERVELVLRGYLCRSAFWGFYVPERKNLFGLVGVLQILGLRGNCT